MIKYSTLFLVAMIITACSSPDKENTDRMFRLVSEGESGIVFNNKLTYTEEFNPYVFKNFYNGGGVALGDINNDGLVDIYLSGNMVANKLYLNQGDLRFKDITEEAGLACQDVWSSGVSMVDLNGDGYLDIYVCKSGDPEAKGVRHNELFINQGDLTFVEKSKEYGLDFEGLSIHASFFDYDRDGDLDCYLLNNSIRPVLGYDLKEGLREVRDSLGGNLLLENTTIKDRAKHGGGHPVFIDVTEESGIYSSAIGFGLGVSVGDFNNDNWTDLYVSNDFFERDYLYINNQNGGFSEKLVQYLQEISMGSMGADIADLNNDGLPEIFVTEMLPRTLERTKTKTVFDPWDKYRRTVDKGYHHQFGRNTLQLNLGQNSERNTVFSEVGRLTGTHATEWSWGALLADFDNDGWKDIFIANGIGKDLLDQDYINYYFSPSKIRELIKEKGEIMVDLFDAMPSSPLTNAFYKNKGNLNFSEEAERVGLGIPSYSNGSAYGDLDNDGDLDLVVSNINMEAHVYENNTDSTHNFLGIDLVGSRHNTAAIGSKVFVYLEGKTLYQEVNPMRGFQSCVDTRLLFGLGNNDSIDSVRIIWPDGKQDVVDGNITVNQYHNVKYENPTETRKQNNVDDKTIFIKEEKLDFAYVENEYIDFDREKLSYYMRSNRGPISVVGDINGDGREDLIIGGSRGFPIREYLGIREGLKFKENAVFKEISSGEVSALLLHDFDDDGDLDLVVGHGSNELPKGSSALKDRLLLNDGKGGFTLDQSVNFPYQSTGAISWIEVDETNYLFFGAREEPLNYGIPPSSWLYKVDVKNGRLSESIELPELGFITSSHSADIDMDGQEEVVFSAHYAPLQYIDIEGGKVSVKQLPGIDSLYGWWNGIVLQDFDKDGDLDLLALNHGLNSRFKVGDGNKILLYVNDFDQNGTIEQILCHGSEEGTFPYAMRDDIVSILPHLKKKYTKYQDYAEASMDEIFPQEVLHNSLVHEVNILKTCLFENTGSEFVLRELPIESQFSINFAAETMDFNEDGYMDFILGGNQKGAKPEVGINTANYGFLFENNGKMKFSFVPINRSGLYEEGQVRDIKAMTINDRMKLIFLKNGADASVYGHNR